MDYQIKWWERLLLRFKFKHYSIGCDLGYKGNSSVLVYKVLRGRIYVLEEIPKEV